MKQKNEKMLQSNVVEYLILLKLFIKIIKHFHSKIKKRN